MDHGVPMRHPSALSQILSMAPVGVYNVEDTSPAASAAAVDMISGAAHIGNGLLGG